MNLRASDQKYVDRCVYDMPLATQSIAPLKYERENTGLVENKYIFCSVILSSLTLRVQLQCTDSFDLSPFIVHRLF